MNKTHFLNAHGRAGHALKPYVIGFHENGFLDHDREPDLVRLGPQLLNALILAVIAA